MKLRKLLRTKALASSDRPKLTIEEALTSIAVELHRANNIAERQLKLAEAAGTQASSLTLLEKFIEPLTVLITQSAKAPVEITSVPMQPTEIEKASKGLRVSQVPGE